MNNQNCLPCQAANRAARRAMLGDGVVTTIPGAASPPASWGHLATAFVIFGGLTVVGVLGAKALRLL